MSREADARIGELYIDLHKAKSRLEKRRSEASEIAADIHELEKEIRELEKDLSLELKCL